MTGADGDLPKAQAPADGMPAGCLRAFVYVILAPFAMVVAYALGSVRIDEHCSECDMAGPEGIAWAIAILLVLLVAIAVGESLHARKRREQSGEPSPTAGQG